MTVEASPNTVITDEQYEMLKQAFGADKSLKDAAEEERRKHQDGKRSSAKEKKAQVAPQEIKTEIPEDMRPRFVTKGHIDLDAPVVATPQPTTPPQPEEPVSAETPTPDTQETTAPAAEKRKPQIPASASKTMAYSNSTPARHLPARRFSEPSTSAA